MFFFPLKEIHSFTETNVANALMATASFLMDFVLGGGKSILTVENFMIVCRSIAWHETCFTIISVDSWGF